MLNEVVLQTSNPMSFLIDDVDPDEILILTSISGLTPPDVTLFTGEFARYGGYYQGRRPGPMYPIFNFKLNEDYVNNIDISQIRNMLYRQFYEPQAGSDGVTVLLKDEKFPDRFFTCYSEKWQGDIFAKDPKGQISTRCVDAFIKSVDPTSATNAGGWLTVPINYDGSADCGIEFDLRVVANTTKITVTNNDQMMSLTGNFVAGDILEIGTIENQRFVKLNGLDKMVLLDAPSGWITLKESVNLFRVYGDTVGDGKVVATSYSYQSCWWGA